jgi:hypothetical protein
MSETYYDKQFEDLPISIRGRSPVSHNTYQITINQITIKDLLDIWNIDDIYEDSEMAQVLRHLRAAVAEAQTLRGQLDAIEARGKANAQERIGLIEENINLKKQNQLLRNGWCNESEKRIKEWHTFTDTDFK